MLAGEWFHGNEKLDPLMPRVSRVLRPRRRPSTRPSFHPNVFSPERLFARTSWPRRRPPTASFDARDFSGPRDASYLRRTLHLPSRKPPRALARRCVHPGLRRAEAASAAQAGSRPRNCSRDAIPGLRKSLAEDDGCESYSAACSAPYPSCLFSCSTKSAATAFVILDAASPSRRIGDPA